jgi:hypothetical protein
MKRCVKCQDEIQPCASCVGKVERMREEGMGECPDCGRDGDAHDMRQSPPKCPPPWRVSVLTGTRYEVTVRRAATAEDAERLAQEAVMVEFGGDEPEEAAGVEVEPGEEADTVSEVEDGWELMCPHCLGYKADGHSNDCERLDEAAEGH